MRRVLTLMAALVWLGFAVDARGGEKTESSAEFSTTIARNAGEAPTFAVKAVVSAKEDDDENENKEEGRKGKKKAEEEATKGKKGKARLARRPSRPFAPCWPRYEKWTTKTFACAPP